MKNILLLSAFIFVAAACSKHDKNPISNVKEALEEKDLQGKNFESDCSIEIARSAFTGILSGGAASVKSSRVAYRFQGSNVTRTTIYFANANCDGEAIRYSETGTFNVTKNQKTNDGGYLIDMNFKKLNAKMASDVGATAANAVKLCGFENWANGQDRDVTAQSKEISCFGAQVPRTNHNVYRLDDRRVLYLGNDGTSTSTDRPASLSREKYTAN